MRVFFLEFILFLLLAHTQTQKRDKYLYKTPKQIVSWGLQEGRNPRMTFEKADMYDGITWHDSNMPVCQE